jgi:hypothetical protein
LICDPDGLPTDIFTHVVNKMIGKYSSEKVPVLVYPDRYADDKNMPYEKKKYIMGILDARHFKEFIEYTKEKFKINYWE